jgi:hypothetical protein
MIERKLSMAEIGLIAGTRVALGAGIGLLLSNRLNKDQRKAAGLALALFGGLTTVPLVLNLIRKGREAAVTRDPQDRRKGPVRSGEDRRKANIPPPPGSPVRSGKDRREADRRSGVERKHS